MPPKFADTLLPKTANLTYNGEPWVLNLKSIITDETPGSLVFTVTPFLEEEMIIQGKMH